MTDVLFTPKAEEAVLSILLNNPTKIFENSNLLPEMFSSIPSQLLYRTIYELSNAGAIASKDLVRSDLAVKGKLNLIGGDEYLDWVIEKHYEVENFFTYEKIIINSYKARKLIELTANTRELIGDDLSSIDSTITSLKDKLDLLSLTTNKNSAGKLSDSIKLAYENLQKRLQNPGLSGLSTGYESLDYITGGHSRGDLWTIAARPSMGKTALAINSLLRTTIPVAGGHNALLFSLEMSKQTVIDRYLAVDTGIDLMDIRLGTVTEDRKEFIEESFVKFKDLNLYLDCEFHLNPVYITDTIKKFYKTEKIDSVYIDYLQLAVERDGEAVHKIGQLTRTLKKLAKDLDISICLLSQLNRQCELRDDKRPILSDLRQSGNIEEDSDVVAFLYRDDYYYRDSSHKNMIEFIVRKNRNGPIGTVMLKFEPSSTRIDEVR
jgi:replicative DNA helicase